MDELEIDGKKYLSSKRAARDHKYHTDYIGQLIRAGRVQGRKVGRAWYVEEKSLKNYLLSEGGQPTATPVVTPAPEPAVIEEVKEEAPVPKPAAEVFVSAPVAEIPVQKPVERVVLFESPKPTHARPAHETIYEEERPVQVSNHAQEKKPSTLRYVEDDEPMLPVLGGRVRTNADFISVPMRRIKEEDNDEETVSEEVVEEEIPALEITVFPRKNFLTQKRIGALAATAIGVFIVAAVVSSTLAQSIKINEEGAASLGFTIK